jgi:hypothetical protein
MKAICRCQADQKSDHRLKTVGNLANVVHHSTASMTPEHHRWEDLSSVSMARRAAISEKTTMVP